MDNYFQHTAVHRIMITAAAFVVVVAGMRAAADMLVPFFLALFFAIIFEPPLAWLQHRKVPAWRALLIVIFSVVVVQLAIVSLISNALTDFSGSLSDYEEGLKAITDGLLSKLEGMGVTVPAGVFANYFSPKTIMDFIATTLGGAGRVLSDTFLILLLVIFMLLEASGFPNKLRVILNDPEASMARIDRVTRNIKRYIAIKTLISFATGSIITLWLMALGVKYAILWGVIAFFLNYVPNIGSLIAAVPAVLLALVQLGPAYAFYAFLGYVIVNNVIGNFIEPKIMGRGMGLSTLVVFLSLLFWGWVLGPVGMLLSIPLTMTAKIILESNRNTNWIAVLLDSKTEVEEALSASAKPPNAS
ncbi:MAG: AI-2E family transporter [Gammaproteobacteria bacterium]|nr:AI-2E family transporter [Gammaproteobacteria bacterium]